MASEYNDTSVALVADSISEIDARLSTLLVGVPPVLADTVMRLPGVVATPIHWGMTRDEIITHLFHFVEAPYKHIGEPTPFGVKLLKTEWRALEDKVMYYINKLSSTSDDVDRELVWNLIQPFVTNHFMLSSTNWAMVNDMIDPDGSHPLMMKIMSSLEKFEPVRMAPEEQWHVPWITTGVLEEISQDAMEARNMLQLNEKDAFDRSMFQAQLVSFSRCARGGPTGADGKEVGLADEIARAYGMMHDMWWRYRDVAAHIATPDRIVNRRFEMVHCHGEYFGWNQYKFLYGYAKTSQDVVAKNMAEMKEAGPNLRVIEGGKDGKPVYH